MSDGLHAELTRRIIGAAMEVHRVPGPGLDEKIYENALCVEFSLDEIIFDQQKQHPVFYKSQPVGRAITDMIVENSVVLEAKVVDNFHDTHIAQLIAYLRLTGLQVDLLLNFKNASLQFKRITVSKPKSQSA